MSMRILSVAVLAGGLALAGCAEQGGPGTRQVIGGGTGAVLGGLAGAALGKGGSSGTRAAATGVGAVLGLIIGSEIGRYMDDADRERARGAAQRAHEAPIGESITWNNPDSGNYGSVTPTRDGRDQAGRYCREYRTTIVVGDSTEEAYGQACQQPDGSWQIIS